MSTARFVVAFDGPGIADGTIDVRDLAPALLSLGQAVDSANRVVNGDRLPARVQATATDVGSFEISLNVVVAGWEAVRGLLLSEDSQAAATLLEYLGFIAGPVGAVGLVALRRWVRGRTPDRIEREGGNITIHIGSESLTVPFDVMRLYQDEAVNRAVGKLLDTFASERVERIEFRPSPKAPADVVLTKEDKPHFELPPAPEEIVVEDTRRMALSIRSLAFQEGNKWRLFDGQNVITATIQDRDFLERVDRNEIRFAKSDVLICEVHTIQRQGPDGLKTEHFVQRVIEHKPAPMQIPLFGPDDRNRASG